MPMPRFADSLDTRKLPQIRRHVRRAGYAAHKVSQITVVTDDSGRLMAVMAMDLVSTIWDEVRIRFHARWRGPLPKVGDYLQASSRARFAFRIDRDPAEINELPESPGRRPLRLNLDVVRVPLPLPPGSRVIIGKWDAARSKTSWIVNAPQGE